MCHSMDERAYPCRKRREGVQSTGHPHPSDASLILHILFSGCKTLHIQVSVSLSKSSTETRNCPLPPIRAMTPGYRGAAAYSGTAAFCLRTDQCCSVTEVSARLSVVLI